MERSQFFAYFLHFVLAGAIAGLSALLTAALARHTRLMDIPNVRSSHARPTPRGGGIAIVCAFLTGISIIHLLGEVTPIRTGYFIGFLASGFVIATISIVDDYRSISPGTKLGVQLIAMASALAAGIVIDQLHLPGIGVVELGWLGYPLSLLWILGLTNAYNFMDGLDGLAASTAVIASAFFCVISFHQGSLFIYLASLVLCAASIGFLVFNLPPARIFMGDVGSTFLGFTLAVMAIIAARYDRSHTSLFVVPLLLFHFIFDAAFTFFRRLWRREPVLQPHRTHLYQLLNRLGCSHGMVALIYSGMAVFQGFVAIWMVSIPGSNRAWVFLPLLMLQSVYAYWVTSSSRRKGLL